MDFFEKYPYIDIIVHGEGEYILKNILQRIFRKGKDWSDVKGISTSSFQNIFHKNVLMIYQKYHPHILTNVIWDLVDKDNSGVDWDCSWETNRGCPYLCTFCDWGSATFTKVRKFLDDRLT